MYIRSIYIFICSDRAPVGAVRSYYKSGSEIARSKNARSERARKRAEVVASDIKRERLVLFVTSIFHKFLHDELFTMLKLLVV